MSSCCCSTNATGKKVVDAHVPSQAPAKPDIGSPKKPKKSSKHKLFYNDLIFLKQIVRKKGIRNFSVDLKIG